MKKILQIVSCLELGGTEAFIMNNYRALDRSNINLILQFSSKKIIHI